LVSEINKAAIEENFRDFVRYVARRIAPGSEADAKVIIAPTPFELAKLLEQRRVDYYFESVYPSYTINYVHGAGKTLLRRWKGGAAEYQSFIFTRRDNGINQLADLRGKTMVFEDPGSTSGYLMPKLFGAQVKVAEKAISHAVPTDTSIPSLPRSKLSRRRPQIAAGRSARRLMAWMKRNRNPTAQTENYRAIWFPCAAISRRLSASSTTCWWRCMTTPKASAF
jgi:phosphonate transport system substrate-binding protein